MTLDTLVEGYQRLCECMNGKKKKKKKNKEKKKKKAPFINSKTGCFATPALKI